MIKDLGIATAYAFAVAGGYTGTQAEFEELMAQLPEEVDNIANLVVNVTTLPAGSQATSSYSDGVLSLGIPKGDKGDPGRSGSYTSTSPISISSEMDISLEDSGATAGTYGRALGGPISAGFDFPIITVDEHGLVTLASNSNIGVHQRNDTKDKNYGGGLITKEDYSFLRRSALNEYARSGGSGIAKILVLDGHNYVQFNTSASNVFYITAYSITGDFNSHFAVEPLYLRLYVGLNISGPAYRYMDYFCVPLDVPPYTSSPDTMSGGYSTRITLPVKSITSGGETFDNILDLDSVKQAYLDSCSDIDAGANVYFHGYALKEPVYVMGYM